MKYFLQNLSPKTKSIFVKSMLIVALLSVIPMFIVFTLFGALFVATKYFYEKIKEFVQILQEEITNTISNVKKEK